MTFTDVILQAALAAPVLALPLIPHRNRRH